MPIVPAICTQCGAAVEVNGDTPGSLDSSPYYENFEAGASITLVAQTRSTEYTFLGWFEPDEGQATHLVLKDTTIKATLEVVVKGQ